MVDTEALFVSIIGVPAGGKSYFLTAMTWELRRQLPVHFALTFGDADTICNQNLNNYEDTLFLQSDPEQAVAIRKTDIAGADLNDEVKLGQQVVSLPKPYLFALRPTPAHPDQATARSGQVPCVYDNAGEHFRPGEDSSSTPVTQPLARSRVLMSLYDPTKDPRFRERCKCFRSDPQLSGSSPVERQETILIEAAQRVKRYTGTPPDRKHDRPLIVILPKADAWGKLVDLDLSREPVVEHAGGGRPAAVDLRRIEQTSARLRRLLMQLTPEFVAAAEDFCEHVLYVPVSVFDKPPQKEEDGFLYTRGVDVRPRWVTAPVLHMFAKWSHGLIGGAVAADAAPAVASGRAQQRPLSTGTGAASSDGAWGRVWVCGASRGRRRAGCPVSSVVVQFDSWHGNLPMRVPLRRLAHGLVARPTSN